MKKVFCALLALAGLSISASSFAANCNPKAQVHQQRAANILTQLQFGQVPTAADQDFMLCMYSEKEDKDAFRARVQRLIAKQQAAAAQEAARRQEQQRQAIERERAAQQAAQEKLARVNRLMTTLPADLPVEVRNAARQYFEAPGPHKAMFVALGGPVPIARMEVGSGNLAYAQFRARESCYYSTNANNTNKPSGCKLLLADESVIWRSSAPLSALEKGTYVKVNVPCGGPYKGLTLRFDDSGLGSATGGSKVEFADTEQPNLFRSMGDNGLLHGNGEAVVMIQSPTQFHWLWRNDERADYRKCSD